MPPSLRQEEFEIRIACHQHRNTRTLLGFLYYHQRSLQLGKLIVGGAGGPFPVSDFGEDCTLSGDPSDSSVSSKNDRRRAGYT